MDISNFEDQLYTELFQRAIQEVITPVNMGIFKKGARDEFIEILNRVNVNPLVDIVTRVEYDQYIDEILIPFHKDIYHLYRSNLVVSIDNPYSYSARILNQYLKTITFRALLFNTDLDIYLKIQHPVISNVFLKAFSEMGISIVNQIDGREKYYEVVKYYRDLLDLEICGKNLSLQAMRLGIDV
ncbi:MAG: hypothetical protein JJU13_12635 [Balneolaceae bacterium]|nr:hypothetical protein [Balneolaceae bacterium]